MAIRALALSAVAAGASLAFAAVAGTETGPAKAIVAAQCAGCHGSDLRGGRGPNLLAADFLAHRTDAELQAAILHGVPGSEMPAFAGILDDDAAFRVAAYLRTAANEAVPRPVFVPDPDGQLLHTEKAELRVEVVARGLDTPWGFAFLPDGRILVTERSGRLRVVEHGRLSAPVTGLPKPWVRQDSGYLDVAAGPGGWVYLAYVDALGAPEGGPAKAGDPSLRSMTVVIRGRIDRRGHWSATQELFRAPPALYTTNGSHYGCRFLLDGRGHLFFTLGDRGEMANARELRSPLGKVHRVALDGAVPRDNPFVGRTDALSTVWSYGHRNPQGLAIEPATGLLWESEHGPNGGDELNLVKPGHDYGWGLASMGVQPGITRREAAGTDPPVTYYTPSIAPSGIGFYDGARIPSWRGSLFVAALTGQQLRRLEVRDGKVIAQEIVFDRFGRARAVKQGPDGALYVLVQNPTGRGTSIALTDPTPGMLLRLVPTGEARR